MCNKRDPFLKEYVIKDDATADRLIRAMEHPVDLMEKFTYHPKEERERHLGEFLALLREKF